MKRFTSRSLFLLAATVACIFAFRTYQMQWAPLDWEPYSKQRVEALLDDHRIVLISLTADWDFSCVIHEHLALRSPQMYKFVRDYKAVPLVADYSKHDPKITSLMEELGITYIPAFIVYSPTKGKAPTVLQGQLNESLLREAIAYARYRPEASKQH